MVVAIAAPMADWLRQQLQLMGLESNRALLQAHG
jgi:hypothetical protein